MTNIEQLPSGYWDCGCINPAGHDSPQEAQACKEKAMTTLESNPLVCDDCGHEGCDCGPTTGELISTKKESRHD